MGRQTDRERTQQIAGYVEQHPGVRPAEIAKALNVPRSSVTRTLPALEDAGRLLYEDQTRAVVAVREMSLGTSLRFVAECAPPA